MIDSVLPQGQPRKNAHCERVQAATLGGEGATLTVRGYRYENPALNTGEDANWVSADAELVCLEEGR